MSNSHKYKFPQNNLYSYNIIAHREKITVQRLIYQGVNSFYGSKKMESYVWGKKIVISDPLFPHTPPPHPTQKILPKTTKD